MEHNIWDGTFIDLTWISSKTPISILEKERDFAKHRLNAANKILRAIQVANTQAREKNRAVRAAWYPPPFWLALNASEPMYGWMLSRDQLSKREEKIQARLRKYHNDLKRIEGILRDKRGTPAAAAAAEESQ